MFWSPRVRDADDLTVFEPGRKHMCSRLPIGRPVVKEGIRRGIPAFGVKLVYENPATCPCSFTLPPRHQVHPGT
jgi:hypothetical protein